MSSITLSSDSVLTWDGSDYLINDQTISALPLSISSSDDSIPITVTLNFTGAITTTANYIVVNSRNMIFDGNNNPITISGALGYGGLLSNVNNNVIIQNIIITVTNSTLSFGAGWVCRSGGQNTTIQNCSSNGPISSSAGGICGSGSSSITINNCRSIGIISSSAGGVIGENCSSIALNNCYSAGNIYNYAGGICGANSTSCTAVGCYSTGQIGSISNYNSGGIFGNAPNSCTATYCFSTGNIYGDVDGSNGGIFGTTFSTANCTATNCYSIGNIGISSGGIYSPGFHSIAVNCYSMGNISDYAGGIFGDGSEHCTATACYNIGNIASDAGGIFGTAGTDNIATYCYNLGTISGNGGSIFGSYGTFTCSFCYTLYGSNSQFGGTDNDGTVANCITENGGSWNDIHANSTIVTGETWFSASPNTPFLLSSFNITSNNNITYGLLPTGLQYFYTIPSLSNVTTITSNGTPHFDTYIITGYYAQPPEQDTILTSLIYGYSILNYTMNITVSVSEGSCFMEGTKILTSNGYIPIEELCIGDMVKTDKNYKNISLIGHTIIYNNKNTKNCIYKYNKDDVFDLFDDLYVTAYHSVPVNNKKILAKDDSRASKWAYEGNINIWHIALDNISHKIYANGLLVESCPFNNLKKSNMTLIGDIETKIISQNKIENKLSKNMRPILIRNKKLL